MNVGKKLSCGAGSLAASDGFGMGPTLLGSSVIGMDGLEACLLLILQQDGFVLVWSALLSTKIFGLMMGFRSAFGAAAGHWSLSLLLARWMRNGFGTQAVDDGVDLLAMGDRDWMVLGRKNCGRLPAR
ncbi:hypothetical protein ACLOJK_003851 [Asimina triloba]